MHPKLRSANESRVVASAVGRGATAVEGIERNLRARAMAAHYEAAKLGMIVMTPDSAWVFLDDRARELMRGIRGFDGSTSMSAVLDLDSAARLISAIRDLVVGIAPAAQLEFDIATRQGGVARFATHLTCWQDASDDGPQVIAAINDVTARTYYDFQRRREEKRLRATVDNAAVGVICTDWNGTFLEVNRQFARMLDHPPSALVGRDFRDFMVPEDVTSHTPRRAALWRGELDSVVIERRWFRRDRSIIWTRLTISVQDDLCDSEPYSVVIVEDITEAKRVAESQRLLVGELSHRVKNTLSIVQGIVRRTLATAATPDEFAMQVEQRLASLSRAHDLLAYNDWQCLTLRALVDEALLAAFNGHRDAFRIVVDESILSPHQAITLAMLLHELATNAIKHGALSAPTGRVRLTSELLAPSAPTDATRVRLSWIERGGPPPGNASYQGFGSFLLNRGASHALNGTATTHFAPEGLELTLTFPRIETRAPLPSPPPASEPPRAAARDTQHAA